MNRLIEQMSRTLCLRFHHSYDSIIKMLQTVEDHVEAEQELGVVVVAGLGDVAPDDLDEVRVVGQAAA